MPLDVVAIASAAVKDTATKALGRRPFELLVSALALTTFAAYLRSTRATGVIADMTHYLGFGTTSRTAHVNRWFTDPARMPGLTWALAAVALLAFATGAVVLARIGAEVRWTFDNMEDDRKGDQERGDLRSFALGRVNRSTQTWMMGLCLLAEMHGFPQPAYGVAALGAVVVGVAIIQLACEPGRSPGEIAFGTAMILFFQLSYAARVFAALPMFLYDLGTVTPWRGPTASARREAAPGQEP
jgi:hypothetical protein